MANKLSICVDLGSDTLKIVCAYRSKAGQAKIVKVVDGRYFDVAIPAVAHYAMDGGEWSYGYQLAENHISLFDTVVKIKDLLSLLRVYYDDNGASKLTEQQQQSNAADYEGSHVFPFFDFPISNDRPIHYAAFCNDSQFENDRFVAAEGTPRKVCEGFFDWVAKAVLTPAIKDIQKDIDSAKVDTEYTILMPSRFGDAYLQECRRLVCDYFAKGAHVSVMTGTKALGVLAVYGGLFSKRNMMRSHGDAALLFDIGEEQMSVVKFTALLERGKDGVETKNFHVDGVSGHLMPVKYGGNNIDAAIALSFERRVNKGPSLGGDAEDATRSSRYYLMKGIKSAKSVLSRLSEDTTGQAFADYPNGVPLRTMRDTMVCRLVGTKEFDKCVYKNPKNNKDGAAERIAQYVVAELKSPVNCKGWHQVNHVFLAGGVAGTSGFLDYIKQYAQEQDCGGIDISVLNSVDSEEWACAIPPHELYAYAACVGCVQMMYKGDKIADVLTRSYGMRMNSTTVRIVNGQKVRGRVEDSDHFTILAEKGTPYDKPIPSLYATFGKDEQVNLRIYSTCLKENEFNLYYSNNDPNGIQSRDANGKACLYFPIENESYMARLKEKMDFRLESPADSNLYLYCDKVCEANRVKAKYGDVWLSIGIYVDKEGYVVPSIKVDVDKCVEKQKESRKVTKLSPADCLVTVVYTATGKEENVSVNRLIADCDRDIKIDSGTGKGA